MDAQEFREFGRAAVDFVADYLENIRDRDVLPSVEPGYLLDLVPKEAPEESEDWKTVMSDINRVIMPGITHWQSPNFHAYYPTHTSYPSIVGEILSGGLGIVGFSWICSPACTELEVVVMDWLAKMLGLPEVFLNSSEGPGGGVIQGSASEAILVAVIAAREQTVCRIQKENPEMSESDIRGKLIAYSSDQSNSAIEKSGKLAAVKIRLLETDETGILTGETLQKAVSEDLALGKIPVICIATMGTTGTCAFDRIEELGPICETNNIWLHVDAAYAGSALVCPEFRPLMTGLELVDSFNFNLHKWMMVNFDCSAMWVKNSNNITEHYNVDRIYLKHKYQDQSMPDYRHWQIQLGRKFRALKVWIVLRTIGAEKIRENIRKQVGLAKRFQKNVESDSRFEIVNKAVLGLVTFRLKGDCSLTKDLLEKITEKKQIYMIPATVCGKFVVRFVICGMAPEEKDIDFAWDIIKNVADESLLKVDNEVFVKDKFDAIEQVTERLSSEVHLSSEAERAQ